MKERAIAFGPGGTLTGILTEPAEARAGAPAVLLSNVGVNHRIGPFRVWVGLARRLASHGITTFRFDRAGLGDSEPRRGATGTELDRALADYADAMRLLASKRGAKEFLLVGLCSGVDPIHPLTRDDDRVVGAAFIDGYTYPTREFRLRRALRYGSPTRLRRWLARRRRPAVSTVGERPDLFERVYPSRDAMRSDVEAMLARRKRLLFIHTAGFEASFNHRRQFFDMLGSRFEGQPLEVEYHAAADHTFSILAHRRWLEGRLVAWALGDAALPLRSRYFFRK